VSFAADRELELSAGTLAYREVGEGRPVLFLHGLLVDGRLWRKVVPSLAGHGRCIVPDWPLGAHRRALRPDADLSPPALADLVAEAIERLGLDRPVLVANDTGGAIAQVLVARRPELLGGLVLTPCDAFENFLPPLFRGLQWLAHVPPLLRVATRPLAARPLRRLPMAFGWLTKRPIPEDIVDAWLEPWFTDPGVRRDTVKLLRGISARYTLDAAERLPRFAGPSTVVWATEDRVFPLEHGRRLAALLRSPLVEVADSYSFVPEDRPEILVAVLRDFLVSAAVGAGGEVTRSSGAS
jgi:pimeloyl-ACP methyl ester carboxylesterase